MRTTSVKTSSEHLTPTIAELSTSGEPVFFILQKLLKIMTIIFFFHFAKAAENKDFYCFFFLLQKLLKIKTIIARAERQSDFFSLVPPYLGFHLGIEIGGYQWRRKITLYSNLEGFARPLIKSASKLCWFYIL